MNRPLIAVAALFALSAPGVAALIDPQKTAQAAQVLKLEGTYSFVRGEKGGQAIPASRLQGHQVVVSADEMIGMDGKKNHVFVTKYKLDPAMKPFRITMTSTLPNISESLGLLEKRGDELWIIYALPGGAAPTSFETKENQQLFVLTQMKETQLKETQQGEKPLAP